MLTACLVLLAYLVIAAIGLMLVGGVRERPKP